MKKNADKKEIRLQNVPEKIHAQISNIASHKGIPVSSVLMPVLIEFVESQPEKYKTPYKEWGT